VAVAPPKSVGTVAAEAPARPVVVLAEPNPWPRRIAWALAGAAVVVVGLVWLTPGFPERWVIGVEGWFTDLEAWIIDNQRTHWLFTSVLGPIGDAIDASIQSVIDLLSRMTWLGLVVGSSCLAGLVAGWRMALLTGLGVLSFGVLGVWDASIETFALMLVAVLVSLAIGMPLGVWAGRTPRAERVLRSVMDAMQTIPAYSYLLPCVLFFGIGYPPALIATVIFALPPAVRLTALGIRSVPATAIEVSGSFGATPRQTLGKVQLPLAKPSMMLGVNQTIMMALGMVVIAAIVGAPGLGREVLDGLKQLDVGEALNGGIAIVVMAIVLDRVTTAWSRRDRHRLKPVRLAGRVLSRRTLWIAAGAIAIAAVLIGREVLRQQAFPEGLTTSVAAPTNAIVDWSRDNLTGIAEAITNVLLRFGLDPLRDLLLGVPWWMVAGAVGLIAWRVSGPRLAVGLFACMLGIGLIGTWELSMETLAVVLVAVLVAIVIAIPVGILAARSDGFDRAIKPVLDAMQTMPAFVYLVPVLLLFAPGRVPAVIASVVYALPVGIRLTNHGIRTVSSEAVEAGNAYGSTPWQLLRKVQLPLARPSILLGVNQTIMMVLSVVIIAGLIGGGGLGFDILVALSQRNIGRGLVGGLSILLLAIVLDRMTQAMGAAPRTMRGPVGMGLGWWTRVRAITGRPNGEADGKGDG
jgi:glycine betaine/proline transport system permease protein